MENVLCCQHSCYIFCFKNKCRNEIGLNWKKQKVTIYNRVNQDNCVSVCVWPSISLCVCEWGEGRFVALCMSTCPSMCVRACVCVCVCVCVYCSTSLRTSICFICVQYIWCFLLLSFYFQIFGCWLQMKKRWSLVAIIWVFQSAHNTNSSPMSQWWHCQIISDCHERSLPCCCYRNSQHTSSILDRIHIVLLVAGDRLSDQ